MLTDAAAADSELSEPFVEKDYWITEILRTVADTLGDRAIFKGGTSLSKGWNLIDRFSEDVDHFVNPAVEPALASPRAIDKVLKHLNQDVASIPGLGFIRRPTMRKRSSEPRSLTPRAAWRIHEPQRSSTACT